MSLGLKVHVRNNLEAKALLTVAAPVHVIQIVDAVVAWLLNGRPVTREVDKVGKADLVRRGAVKVRQRADDLSIIRLDNKLIVVFNEDLVFVRAPEEVDDIAVPDVDLRQLEVFIMIVGHDGKAKEAVIGRFFGNNGKGGHVVLEGRKKEEGRRKKEEGSLRKEK